MRGDTHAVLRYLVCTLGSSLHQAATGTYLARLAAGSGAGLSQQILLTLQELLIKLMAPRAP